MSRIFNEILIISLRISSFIMIKEEMNMILRNVPRNNFEQDMKEAAKIMRKILDNEKKAIREIERIIE